MHHFIKGKKLADAFFAVVFSAPYPLSRQLAHTERRNTNTLITK